MWSLTQLTVLPVAEGQTWGLGVAMPSPCSTCHVGPGSASGELQGGQRGDREGTC